MRGRLTVVVLCGLAVVGVAAAPEGARLEVSEAGHEQVLLTGDEVSAGSRLDDQVPFPTAPDWQNDRRVQVGGLAAADLDGDGDVDLAVGCYHSNSYPPYPDWENLIYFNLGGGLEAEPSWVSADERSTTDVKIALINGDPYPDVIAGNGDFSYDRTVVYFGGPGGPNTTPGWLEGTSTWTTAVLPFDLDHDGDMDLVTANQGNGSADPYRPIQVFYSSGGVLATTPGWQSTAPDMQNFLAFGDYDHDGWEDLAVSKWVNSASGVYRNLAGVLEVSPSWTTGEADSDKGVGWADVDGNGWLDLALGHDPTRLYSNTDGTLGLTWSATGSYFGHSDLRFEDVDLDGDQDLAEIHFSNGMARIYLNRDGVLDSTASWSYDGADVGTALAFGDIDGSGTPDLILGFSGQPSVMVFLSRLEPVLFGDGFESGDAAAWSEVSP